MGYRPAAGLAQDFFCQASFLDLDKIPVYHPNDEEQHIFNGKWIGPKQRLYRTKDRHKTDADVNGAYNIPGKLQIPAVFANGGFFMTDNIVYTTTTPTHVNTYRTNSLDADIIIKNAPDPVFVSDLEGKILSANDAVYELLGFRTDQVLEQSLSRFISAEETREFTAALREVIERGATRNARLNPRSASGKIIPTTLNASALRDADGKVIGAIGILRDMRELDKALAYADNLIKNAPDPVFVSDLEGKILQANDAVYELLGFRTDEVLEQSLSRFISPEETREFLAALREVIERGVIRNTRLNPLSASGEVIPTTLNASALRDADGNVIGAIGILRDMRELDKALAYSDSLIKNAPDPVFVSDLEGKILQANDAVYELLGFRTDEVLEQSLSRFISPEETREFTAALREVIERGATRNARLNPRSASGKIIPTTLNASALRDPDGKAIGAIGILRDMRELDKTRAYADSLIKNAPDPVFVSDLEGKILQANDAVYALLGFRTDEVLEQSLSRFISPEETREFTAALREVIERGVIRNTRLNPLSASGEVIPTTLNASALRDADGKVIGAIGILRDMRELDKALAYSDSLIKNAPDPVFVSDLEGKILQANDAVYALLGFRTDEVLEQSLSRFISPEETREFLAALREVIERGVIRNTHLNPRSASGEVIPTTLNASALRDADGKPIGAIGILRDMRAYEKVVLDLQESKAELQEKILDLEKFEEVVVGRELKMIALEKEIENLKKELDKVNRGQGKWM
jgi:PAS domain S-box-containing protein